MSKSNLYANSGLAVTLSLFGPGTLHPASRLRTNWLNCWTG
ncbi:MAG: hypothetical protein ACYS1A_14760 [Planctomycetota bacterium]